MNTGAFMHDLLDWIDNNLCLLYTSDAADDLQPV